MGLEDEQIQGRLESDLLPPTPLSDGLDVAYDSFTHNNLAEVLDAPFGGAFADIFTAPNNGVLATPSSELVIVAGAPRTGKTTFISEQVGSLHYLLTTMRARISEDDVNRRIKFVEYEVAQQAIIDEGFGRDEDETSEATRTHYEKTNSRYEEMIRSSLGAGVLVIAEAPGMIHRGNEAHENLIRDSKESGSTNVSFIFLLNDYNLDGTVREERANPRSVKPFSRPSIPGGTARSQARYGRAAGDSFYEEYQQGSSGRNASDVYQYREAYEFTVIGSDYVRQELTVKLLRDTYMLDPEHVFVGVNRKKSDDIPINPIINRFSVPAG